jgi:hypothetical protein
MARIALYEKFPGLIIDDEITRFNVCVECGVVTKNLSANHRCQTQVPVLVVLIDTECCTGTVCTGYRYHLHGPLVLVKFGSFFGI